MSHTPEQALAEARHLYETRTPIVRRAFDLSTVRAGERASWYERQVRRSYPYMGWEEAERCFYGDLATVLAYVNAGYDENLVGDLRYNFRRLCRQARGIAERIHGSDPSDLARRLAIFGLRG